MINVIYVYFLQKHKIVIKIIFIEKQFQFYVRIVFKKNYKVAACKKVIVLFNHAIFHDNHIVIRRWKWYF